MGKVASMRKIQRENAIMRREQGGVDLRERKNIKAG
jgi:hypothetical protein